MSEADEQEQQNIQPGYTGPSLARGNVPPRSERVWIDRAEQLREAIPVLLQSPVIAVDAEFTQGRFLAKAHSTEKSNGPRLAVLQIAVERVCYVIDGLRLHDLSPLQAVFDNPNSVTLLHGAGADIRVLADRGLAVVHYYDLEAASRSIFGQHESSLAAMMQRAFGAHLDKSLQRTDWSRRPLPPAMIAYAARDAEVTLALYAWLKARYSDALAAHEYSDKDSAVVGVASWIAPFLIGNSPTSVEQAVTEAKAQGVIRNKTQIASDCRAALSVPMHPQQRSRLLRLIADLSLTQLVSDIVPFLSANTSDVRGAAVRALGRLNVKSVRENVEPLLNDPVYDVRKAALNTLNHFDGKVTPPKQRHTPTKAADGTRTWTIGAEETSQKNDDDDGWRARLRSIIGD